MLPLFHTQKPKNPQTFQPPLSPDKATKRKMSPVKSFRLPGPHETQKFFLTISGLYLTTVRLSIVQVSFHRPQGQTHFTNHWYME